MALVTGITLPNNGDRIKAENYNDPITKILAQVNGNLDSTNIASLSGSKITGGSLPVGSLADDVAAGWFPSSDTLTYGANNGNKEYTVTMSGDKTTKYSNGMRIKLSRSTTPPTHCTDLESGSSQYATKSAPTGITFTDDFTCEAWVKLESYTGARMAIVSRYDGTSGFIFSISATGAVELQGLGAGVNRLYNSYQSVPLGRWVHVAATLDMSGGISTVYINGVSVAVQATSTSGSALTQAGNLQVGAFNGGGFFDGKLADIRIWNAIRAQVDIRTNMNQQLAGSETNLVFYAKLDNNFNDSTSNANNLTGQNSAVATDTDNPMKSVEYGIITNASYSLPNTTLTIFTGTDYNIPNGALANFYYSSTRAPYGFPGGDKWLVDALVRVSVAVAIGATGTWFDTNHKLSVPTGAWKLMHEGAYSQANSSNGSTQLSTTLTGATAGRLTDLATYLFNTVASAGYIVTAHREKSINISAQEIYTLQAWVGAGAGSITAPIRGDVADSYIKAECLYL
jgi:hypothetical protein